MWWSQKFLFSRLLCFLAWHPICVLRYVNLRLVLQSSPDYSPAQIRSLDCSSSRTSNTTGLASFPSNPCPPLTSRFQCHQCFLFCPNKDRSFFSSPSKLILNPQIWWSLLWICPFSSSLTLPFILGLLSGSSLLFLTLLFTQPPSSPTANLPWPYNWVCIQASLLISCLWASILASMYLFPHLLNGVTTPVL